MSKSRLCNYTLHNRGLDSNVNQIKGTVGVHHKSQQPTETNAKMKSTMITLEKNNTRIGINKNICLFSAAFAER